MQSGGDRGLTTAEVAERVADGRVNRVDAGTGRTVGEILRANLVTPVNAIMVTLFVVIVAAGYPRDGLFVGVVVSNVVIGVWQELKARRELHRLAVLNAASATAGEHAGGDTDPRLERVLEALGAIANSDPDPNPTMLALRTALPAGDWTLVASRPFSSATKWSATQFAGHGAFYLGLPRSCSPATTPFSIGFAPRANAATGSWAWRTATPNSATTSRPMPCRWPSSCSRTTSGPTHPRS